MVAASATSSAESSADLEPATATKHPTDPKVPRLIIAAFSFNRKRPALQCANAEWQALPAILFSKLN